MPIAIDSSSPAITAVASGARTTAAFSPPKDSVVVAMAADEYSFGAPNISNTGSLTWTQVVERFASGSPSGSVGIWVAVNSSAQSGITVTTTGLGGSTYQVLKVLVLTGADLDDPVGQSGSGGATTSNLSATAYTAETTGSLGLIMANDGTGGGTVSVGGGDTAYVYSEGSRISGAAIVKATTATEGAAVGFSITASGSREWNWGAVEIRPGPEAFLPRPPLIAGQAAALNRSYYW